jgi:preprotein translocase subunit SecF
MAAGQQHKFFEVIKPGTDIDFVGTRRIWMGISILATLVTIAMLPLNAFVIPGRGQALNWSVEFKGGSEIETHFSKEVDAADVRGALESAGYHGVEVFRSFAAGVQTKNDFTIRMGAVAPVSPAVAKKAEETLRAQKIDGASMRSFELSEGGDKLYLRLDKTADPAAVTAALKGAGINPTQVQAFGRAEDHNYEATLVGLESEVKKALEAKMGADTVTIKQASSVGAKAGAQLVNDGIKAMLGSILLIVVYVAFRFDFRYGPGTIVALLHDAILVIGAFAITYKEFSLTTLAAILTIIGFSMNDTIVVFDRIRENVAKHRDRRFDRVVNLSVNETLSRTILTSATVFFVTLAMNIFGAGAIRDFAFAMNVGVIVGTYSSVFIAAPVLIWLNDKYVAAQKRQAVKPDRQGRRPVRRSKDDDGDSAEA